MSACASMTGRGCDRPVTHADSRGFIYCTECADRRRNTGERVRKLTGAEIASVDATEREAMRNLARDLAAALGAALDALHDVATSDVRPGHPEYASKAQLAATAQTIVDNRSPLLARARALGVIS
jgi:hypothetical protein